MCSLFRYDVMTVLILIFQKLIQWNFIQVTLNKSMQILCAWFAVKMLFGWIENSDKGCLQVSIMMNLFTSPIQLQSTVHVRTQPWKLIPPMISHTLRLRWNNTVARVPMACSSSIRTGHLKNLQKTGIGNKVILFMFWVRLWCPEIEWLRGCFF